MRKKYLYRHIRRLAMLTAIAIPSLLSAGNIPQYQVSKGTNKYVEFTDGIPIPCNWTEGTKVIYPGGYETTNPRSAEGFPIGFDFRLGGRMFNQFVVSYAGNVYLGKDAVNYRGDAFSINMSPISTDIKKSTISYRTSGDEGNKVLEIQYKNAVLNESSKYPGQYSLQIRLYESDGKIEMALKEINTVAGRNQGFDTSLSGWDNADQIGIYSEGLDKPISSFTGRTPYMLDSDTYVHWDENDYDNDYCPVFVFTPTLDMTKPTGKPENLAVCQVGNTFQITCDKAPSADATVLLCSTEPFTDSDYPVDGETFRGSYYDLEGVQIIPTSFGNAKALYYGNKESISLTLDNVEDGQDYYFLAMSANGYPAYGHDNVAEVKIETSQAAPGDFIATALSAHSVNLAWESDYPVIIAATTELVEGYMLGYTGVFGTPSADARIDDEIEGGGKVIYVGEAKDLKVDVEPNSLTLFRAWSVNGNILSATASDAAAVPKTSFPYEPRVENYPIGESLIGWTAPQDQFVPWVKQYDNAKVLKAISIVGNEVALETPGFDLSLPTHISFEYSLETVRPANDQGVPMGNRPGDFGNDGALKIKTGGETMKSISTYSGTMTECPDGYESGSSTFEVVELDIDAIGKDEKIIIAFNTDETSYLYIRNIRITQTGEAPKAPESGPTNAVVKEDEYAVLYFSCDRAEDAEYTLVLFSDKPISSDDYPEDGVVPAVGGKTGNAVVLYYGSDEKVECQTDYDIVIPDYDTTYYFVALAASGNPFYNRNNLANVEYTTATDGIEEVVIDASNTEVYNVMGIRINTSSIEELPQGIYIINGKKVIVK